MAKRKKIPAQPSGRVGAKRPGNKARRRRRDSQNEADQSGRPDARFGDERRAESTARDHPGGARSQERAPRYKNTDETF
jgi:hypothetical protein